MMRPPALTVIRESRLRTIAALLACLFASGASAQLSTLVPRTMTHLTTPNNGSLKAAHLEIVFSEPLEGVEVIPDSQNASPDPSYPTQPGRAHARALSVEQAGVFARKVTVVHPDFAPCVIMFDSIGFTDKVKAGEHYLIEVEVPGMTLVEANKAFYNLDFPTAAARYQEYLDSGDGKDASLAAQRLAVIAELADANNLLDANIDSKERATLFRCMKAAEMIHDKTRSPKAYELYRVFRKRLFPSRAISEYDDEGVTRLAIDTVYHKQGDNRPMSDSRLPKVDGQPYYSWINVGIDLDDVSFTGGDQFLPAERVDGDYRLYVPKGTAAAGPITIHHPDCEPLVFSLADYGIPQVGAASVYVVKVATPPALLIEANRAFGNLDFATAGALYEEILMQGNAHGEEALTTAGDRLEVVRGLVENDATARWKALRKEISAKGSTFSRSELSDKCLVLATMAETFDRHGVPGMQRKAANYRRLAKDYRTALFITISAMQSDDHGKPVFDAGGEYEVYRNKEFFLEFDKSEFGGDELHVAMKTSTPGLFKRYLPGEVSQWFAAHPYKSLKVKPVARVYRNGGYSWERIGDDFDLYSDKDARSFSITLYLKSPE